MGWICCVLSIVAGCGGNDSALFCLDQSAAPEGVGVTNQCDQIVVVVADNKERLVIEPGATHQLLQNGRMMAACFSPAEPVIDGNEFSCQ